MSFINSCLDCAENPPAYAGEAADLCNNELRVGGVGRIVAIACSLDIDYSDTDAVIAAVADGSIVITGCILGDKPAGTPNTKLVCSCAPERVISKTEVVNFSDYNADLVGCTVLTFWDTVSKNSRYYKWGYTTCGGLFIGDYTAELNADLIIEQTCNDSTYVSGSLTYTLNGGGLFTRKPDDWSAVLAAA